MVRGSDNDKNQARDDNWIREENSWPNKFAKQNPTVIMNPTTNYLDSAKTNFSIYLKLNISQLGASCRFDWLTKVKQIYKPSCLMFHDPALMWNIYKSNISFLAGSVLFKKLVS